MMIAKAEVSKRELTDKYVVVQEGIPELRRFSGLTGQVKTVNMNGRALVQFDNPVDISWYDIDPTFLKVVDAPAPKPKEHAKPAAETPSEKPKPAASPATAAKSPLEALRAAKPTGAAAQSPLEALRAAKPSAASPPPAAGEKKLSPIEVLKQQAAAKAAQQAQSAPEASAAVTPPVAATPAPAEPAPAPATAPAPRSDLPKPGSTAEILALLRKQGPAQR
ncbi:hypothetical protein [Planctomicrobium sp. SH664]|uniref:hypothetical protein n=1 Tax=Planctomicrobium sp. SH664 TaxID=3448125 RepID=UPI003F5B5E33